MSDYFSQLCQKKVNFLNSNVAPIHEMDLTTIRWDDLSDVEIVALLCLEQTGRSACATERKTVLHLRAGQPGQLAAIPWDRLSAEKISDCLSCLQVLRMSWGDETRRSVLETLCNRRQKTGLTVIPWGKFTADQLDQLFQRCWGPNYNLAQQDKTGLLLKLLTDKRTTAPDTHSSASFLLNKQFQR